MSSRFQTSVRSPLRLLLEFTTCYSYVRQKTHVKGYWFRRSNRKEYPGKKRNAQTIVGGRKFKVCYWHLLEPRSGGVTTRVFGPLLLPPQIALAPSGASAHLWVSIPFWRPSRGLGFGGPIVTPGHPSVLSHLKKEKKRKKEKREQNLPWALVEKPGSGVLLEHPSISPNASLHLQPVALSQSTHLGFPRNLCRNKSLSH